MSAVLTTAFRLKVAAWVKELPAYLAWGTGNPIWGATPPQPTADLTDLVAEVGRKLIVATSYVTPDVNGDIILRNGSKWSISPSSPTYHILYRVVFEPEEGADNTIREFGLFVDGTTDPELPEGQLYFTPDQVVAKGQLLCIDRSVFVRQDLTQELFDFVLTC